MYQNCVGFRQTNLVLKLKAGLSGVNWQHCKNGLFSACSGLTWQIPWLLNTSSSLVWFTATSVSIFAVSLVKILHLGPSHGHAVKGVHETVSGLAPTYFTTYPLHFYSSDAVVLSPCFYARFSINAFPFIRNDISLSCIFFS